jgi:hypothetical protein
METTEKIILLLVGKLKLQSQRAILMIITQPTIAGAAQSTSLESKCTPIIHWPVSIGKHG